MTSLHPGEPVLIDGMHLGRVVRVHPAGQFVVRVEPDRGEPYSLLASWDGEAVSAISGAPLLVSQEL